MSLSPSSVIYPLSSSKDSNCRDINDRISNLSLFICILTLNLGESVEKSSDSVYENSSECYLSRRNVLA